MVLLSPVIITSCSSSRLVAPRAAGSSKVPQTDAPFEFQININPMDISAGREVNWMASSTYVFRAVAKKDSYVGSTRILTELKSPSGKQPGKIYIPSDKSCKLYMVSCDSKESLNITNEHVNDITNHNNYLWGKCEYRKDRRDVSQVYFSHLTALLEIAIEGLDEMGLTRPTIWLTPPNDTNVTLDLATGTLSPATTIKEVFEPMRMNGTVGRLLIVPLKQVQRIEVKIMATEKQGNNKKSKCISGVLEVPLGGFKSGFHYSFIGVIENGIIYFSTQPNVSKRNLCTVALQTTDKIKSN